MIPIKVQYNIITLLITICKSQVNENMFFTHCVIMHREETNHNHKILDLFIYLHSSNLLRHINIISRYIKSHINIEK